MREFKSFLSLHMKLFVKFRTAGGSWNDTYETYLYYFDRYCAEAHHGKSALTNEMVEGWCTQRDTESSGTCRLRCYAIANFVNYLRARGVTDVLPPRIPANMRSAYIPHAFTKAELERFFQASDDMPMGKPNSLASRTRRIVAPVFFRLLYSSGIRTYEARMLKVGDADLDEGVLSIRDSKGPSQHYVALHDTMAKLLREYDRAIRGLYPERDYFFPSPCGSHLSKKWVSYNFRLIWYSVNAAHAIAYDLRSNYATTNINRWIGEGFGFFPKLVCLSKSMGHEVLDSTKYYVHLVPVVYDVLQALSGDAFNDIVPEVPHE